MLLTAQRKSDGDDGAAFGAVLDDGIASVELGCFFDEGESEARAFGS